MIQIQTPLRVNTPKPDLKLHQILSDLKGLSDFIGLRRVKEITHYREARNGKPENNLVAIDEGLMVEVLWDGYLAYAATSSLSAAGICKAAERALLLAKAGAGYKIYDFSNLLRPKAQGEYQSLRNKDLAQGDLKDFTSLLAEASKNLKVSDKIVNTAASAQLIETEFEYVTSLGTNIQQNFLMISSHFSATAKDEHDSQTRSLGGPRGLNLQTGLEAFESFGLKNDLQLVGEEAVALLTAPNCPSETCDLILMPNQMYIQIHESIGHPLEMDRILGDERNFAGWSFVKPEDIGSLQYGSAKMNVTFDPTVPGEFASYAFDESGLKATREHLIRDGKLVRGLGGLESQARMQKPGVANFRAASWSRAPIDRMANINVEPGESSLSEMIAKTEKGFIMEANISWSIDDYRNKFQFGCEKALQIQDGQIKGLVKNPNYRGNTLQFWRNLDAVGRKEEVGVFGSPYCGKGEPSQVIRVGHSSPPCLFKNIECFGGGK